MRKILALTLALGVAVLVGGIADATVGPHYGDQAAPTGVRYDWWGSQGELSVVGEPGSSFVAFDCLGNPVAAGQLDEPCVAVPAGNSGVGPNGVVIFVALEGDVVAVTDPDWEWN